LILDDEERVREEIEEFLLEKSFTVLKAEAPSRAFKLLADHEVDILILDIKLPEMDGLQVLNKVKTEHPDIEVIMISGHGDINSVIEAMRLGATDFFQKPFRLVDINTAIERTKRFVTLNTKLRKVEQQYSFLSKELQDNIGHQLIGKSKALKSIVNLMTKVAEADPTTVLITGESGTGKELVARGIHFLSRRKNEYFYTVNCSAIPESLFESEFFGHKKGSFTGADQDKVGCFEIADHGTLFLDEIQPVDVRVITASNQNLERLIEKNKFRLDLYHRLTSFIIHIPPLRERKNDIPLLIEHFSVHFAEKLGKHIKEVDPEISIKLRNYNFPGNIRELKNLVERAMILSDNDRLDWNDLEMIFSGRSDIGGLQRTPDESLDLENIEKQTIIKALGKANHNKSMAAYFLNITWQSLNRRMRKYEIER
jgi:DNA-binding NtrC family response regulator